MREEFLFGLAFVWLLFAAIYDIKKREVPNWLNFSLLSFGLAYRAIYSSVYGDWMFLVYGLVGVGVCWIFALGMYYGRVFAGGDAKLLIALGAVLPYNSLLSVFYSVIGFIFLLFLVGVLWGILYSSLIAWRNWGRFKIGLRNNVKRYKSFIILGLILGFAIVVFGFYQREFLLLGIVLILVTLLYVYLKSVEGCMTKLIDWRDLTEGDWIVNDINVGSKYIRKTIHGLTKEDIKILQKAKRKVIVKEGIPFVPPFLFAFVIMVFFLAKSGSFEGTLKAFLA